MIPLEDQAHTAMEREPVEVLRQHGWRCSPEQLLALARSRALADLRTEARKELGEIQPKTDHGIAVRRSHRFRKVEPFEITPIPKRIWLSNQREEHIVLPDAEIPGFLMVRLPLRMSNPGEDESLQEMRRFLLERYEAIYRVGVRVEM